MIDKKTPIEKLHDDYRQAAEERKKAETDDDIIVKIHTDILDISISLQNCLIIFVILLNLYTDI